MEPNVGKKVEISVVLGVFTALAVFGSVLTAFSVEDFSRAHASLSWPEVEGVVLSGEIRDGVHAKPFRYVYSVDGRSYESGRLRFFTARFSSLSTVDVGTGETVPVFVDPDDPSVSVLHRGGGGVVFAALVVIGSAMVFIGLGGVFRTLTTGALDSRARRPANEIAY